METRIDFTKTGKEAMGALFAMGKYLAKSTIERKLLHLVELRVSQINKCAYCLDMHSKDLRHEGDTEQRIYCLEAWREAPFYTPRERAALAWAEAVTVLTDGFVPDAVYEEARKEFNEQELTDLTLAITTINTWNRINVSFRTPAGSYEPGQFASAGA